MIKCDDDEVKDIHEPQSLGGVKLAARLHDGTSLCTVKLGLWLTMQRSTADNGDKMAPESENGNGT